MTETTLVTSTSAGAGPQLRATSQPDLEAQAQGIVQFFEQHRAEWRDGFSMQLGWAPFTLREQDGGFVIVAPDFAGDPRVDTTEDLTMTIFMMVSLMATASLAGAEPDDVSWTDDVLCVKGWDTHHTLALTRAADRDPGDSGWFIDLVPTPEGEATPDRVECVPAWRVMQVCLAAAQALALPAELMAFVRQNRIVRIARRDTLEVVRDLS